MHISKLTLVNYRNFARTALKFRKGVNTIIGENGSGKSNVFRAIRLLLDDTFTHMAYRLVESDFNRSLESWRGHWIIISLEFDELSPDETVQALFVHSTGDIGTEAIKRASYNLIFRPKKEIRLALSALEPGDTAGMETILQGLSIDQYESVFTGRSTADFSDLQTYQRLVGNFETASFPKELDPAEIGVIPRGQLSVAREVAFTFIQALRDVVAEFHNSRTNPLLTLLRSKSGDIDAAALMPIVETVRNLNESIEALDDVRMVRDNISETIKDAVGETYSPSQMSIRSDLPDEADRLFQSLRLFVGESGEGYQGAIHELSLGGANLIFLTLKLLEFKYQRKKELLANFLLIEEPEAHIHTHIQKALFDRVSYEDAQVIYSTHSTNVSEVSNVESMNILGQRGGICEAYQPSAGLSPADIGNIQRYLDAVRSNLLFAKSVLLVEGDAEEILLPILVKKVLGVSVDELGISIVNVRSTSFGLLSVLFHDKRIRKRCAIVTDRDAAIVSTTVLPGDDEPTAKFKKRCQRSAEAGNVRHKDLTDMVSGNSWLEAYFADHTFEVDFIKAGNAASVIAVLPEVYSDGPTIATATAELLSGTTAVYGSRVLRLAGKVGKGWFAIMVGKKITYQTKIPEYLREAISFAHGPCKTELFCNIIEYRLNSMSTDLNVDLVEIEAFRGRVSDLRAGALDRATIVTMYGKAFPHDELNRLFKGL